ncbi:MAG: hypothetical protein H6722_32290 [Sandaracinus sp.]|nr:hypothetical protein [Myxococcales bacterium]MCB9617134.1 hypothetical protein [Sandaracinus sp.]
MPRTFVLLAALAACVSSSVSAQDSARAPASSESAQSSPTDTQRAIWWAVEHDPHRAAAECRQVLRLEVPTPQMRRDRRTRRLERAGWTLVGLGLLSGVVGGLVVGLSYECGDDDWCILPPGVAGLMTGAAVAAVPVVAGLFTAGIGVARRRRARREGTWSFALHGAGGRLGLSF